MMNYKLKAKQLCESEFTEKQVEKALRDSALEVFFEIKQKWDDLPTYTAFGEWLKIKADEFRKQ